MSGSDAVNNNIKGPAVSREIFGGVLEYDAAGFYPGLELLNLVFCSESDEFLPSEGVVKIKRRSHHFARRLVWDDQFKECKDIDEVIYDRNSEEAVRHLLLCLQLPIPNQSKSPEWHRAHFFPYTKSLIHWDARWKNNKIAIERKYLRGGGALAFHILRKDPDIARLQRCRKGFENLYTDNIDSALERVAKTLLQHGYSDPTPQEDRLESECNIKSDEFEDVLRNGVVNILEHVELSAVARIRSLMNWIAFWLILIQHSRSSSYLGREQSVIICDCGSSQAQLRRASQRCLKDLQGLIIEAVDKAAAGGNLAQAQKTKLKGFFWASAATIKLLNSWRGRRHFILGLDLVETLVLAATSQKAEIPFEEFVGHWLYDKWKLVVGRSAAEKNGQLNSIDASVFEDNENHLALQMKTAGLLTEYSDATRMVGTGGML